MRRVENTSLVPCPERATGAHLVLSYEDNPIVSVDARFLDRVLATENELVLSLDGASALLTIQQGEVTAVELAGALAPFTRAAPIRDDEALKHTRALFDACSAGRSYTESFVVVGEEQVRVSDSLVYVGDFACWVKDVEAYAAAAASIPLPNGTIQAALIMLVVTQHRRIDDRDMLWRRISEYENPTG